MINLFADTPVLHIQCAREEAASALDQLQEVESEIKYLRTMSQRMILSEEEMVCIKYWAVMFTRFPLLFMAQFCRFICNLCIYVRKKLFSRGVGLLDIGSYVFDMVSNFCFLSRT